MQKKLLPSYSLPTLVKGTYTHYIKVYADTKSGQRLRRFRLTFNINRINNLREREERAEDLVKKIKSWLDAGFWMEDFNEKLAIAEIQKQQMILATKSINLIEAVTSVKNQKIGKTNRRSSKRTIESHYSLFIAWLNEKNYQDFTVAEFTQRFALEYVDYWRDVLKVDNPNTFNTKLIYIKGCFIQFVKREYITKNPFDVVETQRKRKTRKENFTMEEMVLIGNALKEKNKWLWMASQLAFWGLVRQEEMSRIRFSYFDVEDWVITSICQRMPPKIINRTSLPYRYF